MTVPAQSMVFILFSQTKGGTNYKYSAIFLKILSYNQFNLLKEITTTVVEI